MSERKAEHMDIGGEINKIFEEASPSTGREVEVLATDMLLDMQKLVQMNAELIQTMAGIITDLEDRVKVLEGKV